METAKLPEMPMEEIWLEIKGEIKYDPSYFRIHISAEDLRQRLADEGSLSGVCESLAWDTDYSELESDPYWREIVVGSVTKEK